MSEMKELFDAMNEDRKERHRKQWAHNMAVIIESKTPCTSTNNGECVLFRNENKPRCDFYPSTGKWRHRGKMHGGGAERFLAWYERSGNNGSCSGAKSS